MFQRKQKSNFHINLLIFFSTVILAYGEEKQALQVFQEYCFDCHDNLTKKGNLNLEEIFKKKRFDGTLIFENLVFEKMPPADKDQPSNEEKQRMLEWLADFQPEVKMKPYRRTTRHEFVHSVNDLLGTNLNLVNQISEDRGTRHFDTDRRIELSKEIIGTYFKISDDMLEFAFPENGIPNERIWITNKVKDSHATYNIYHRSYKEGVLFSWTRANNGNVYSFFYDHFDPPIPGWYDLTFEVEKVGKFPEDIALQVYGGKYYYADDRPQPQRLLEVITVGNKELNSKTIRVFLYPGENVSVHCYSKHNFRQKDPTQGIYIKELRAQGPFYEKWPPTSYQQIFRDLPIKAWPRETSYHSNFQTNLQKIGGKLQVSSYQEGMGKEKMQDGSHQTFWHTQYQPTLAQGPHYVIIDNLNGAKIDGLNYATWTEGNGNGQVEGYSIYLSNDGKSWGDPFMEGRLETRLANEQSIQFPKSTSQRFIKFLITDAISENDPFVASIGKFDVLIHHEEEWPTTKIVIDSSSKEDLKGVIRNFAQRAFSTSLSDEQLRPFFDISLSHFSEHKDFVQATKAGLKAIITSVRFLTTHTDHTYPSHAIADYLSRVLWLSIPDELLQTKANENQLNNPHSIRSEIDRMLNHDHSDRMIQSICDQWLNLRSWKKVSPSLKLYPKYNDLLDYYLPKETQTYLKYLIRNNQPVSHLIDSNYTFLNQRLAEHYEIGGIIGHELRKVTVPPEIPRGGLLTMGSVLKITTDGYDTSPILRGAWISKNVIGNPLSPPPESVEAIEPEHGTKAATLRELIKNHKNNKTCYACHKSIDPYGFALENFDATGQWRTKYRVKKDHQSTFQYRPQGYYSYSKKVDAYGEIKPHSFNDIFGLKKILLTNHRKIAYNFSKQFFEYANGYKPNLKQRIDLLSMTYGKAEDCGMKDLISDVLVYSLKETLR